MALAIVGTLALSGCGGEDDEQTLTVLAAASLTETFTALAEEFEIVSVEMRAGKERSQVLRDFGTRAGVSDISSFVTVLIQSSQFGTSIAEALRVYAAEMRDKRVMRAEEKAKAAAVRDAKENEKAQVGRKDDVDKVEGAGGVEGDVKSKLKDERQRLNEPDEEKAQPSKEVSSDDKSVEKAEKEDPETKQSAKQRQLEEAEEDTRQRLADFKENKNEKALADIQRAYDSAMADKDKTIQSFEQELSGYYPADKAKDLARQNISSKKAV